MKKRLLLLLLAGLLLTGCGNDGKASDTSGNTNGSETGSESGTESEGGTESDTEQEPYVLVFEAKTIDGEAMTSDIFAQSKLTMLNVWATYCSPCINEMPDLGEIGREYDKSEFQIVGIICDVMEISTEDEKAKARDIIEQTKADYPHLLLNDALYYNMVGASSSVPTTYFFNEKGELLGYLVGAQSKENWESIIDGLLDELNGTGWDGLN